MFRVSMSGAGVAEAGVFLLLTMALESVRIGSNCRQWGSSELNAKSTSQNFIWAEGPGDPITSDDPEYSISQHADKGNFQLNLVTATGGDTANPFTASASTGSNGSGSGSGSGSSSTSDADSGNTGSSSVTAPMTKADKVLLAHGMLVAISPFLL